MKKMIAFVFGITSILFFSVMIVLSIFRIISIRENYHEIQSLDFIRFERSLRDMYAEGRGYNSEQFRNAAKDYMMRTDSLSVLLVYSYDEGLLYFLPRNAETFDTSILDFQGISTPRIQYNRITEKLISVPFSIQGKKGVVLEGVFNVLDSGSIFILLRDTLIAFCIFFLITCIVIAIASIVVSRDAQTAVPDFPGNVRVKSDQQSDGTIKNAPSAEYDYEKNIVFKENIPDYHPDESTENFMIDAEDIGIKINDVLDESIDTPDFEEEPLRRADKVPLLDKIEEVLQEAENRNTELILSLVTTSFQNNAEHYSLLKELLNRTFHDVVSVLDYTDGTTLVLLHHTDLDDAIHEFEKLYGHMQYEANTGIQAGLTVKSGRSITAQLFLKEAEQALARTRDEQGERIIGFKPDPDRYRSILSNT